MLELFLLKEKEGRCHAREDNMKFAQPSQKVKKNKEIK